MTRRGWLVLGLAALGVGVIAGVGGLVGAGGFPGAPDEEPAPGTVLVTGYHEAGEQLSIASRTIDGGRYTAGYSLEVKVVSSMPDATVECALADLSGALSSIDQPAMSARADGTWTRLEFSDTFEFPDLTLALRCSPTATGELNATFRDIRITASRKIS